RALAAEAAGDHVTAESLLKAAIRSAHAVGPESSVLVAQMLVFAGAVRLRQGDPDGAAGAATQALTFLHVGAGEPLLDGVTAGAALRTIAHALRVKGDLGEAMGAYMRAIEILRDYPGETYASTLNNFGALQSHI